jgi:tetratricopeptide (TPR) repeat protein
MHTESISFLFTLTLVLLCTTTTANEIAQQPQPVHFATSCSPEIRDRFDYGVTMLHSFEYPETSRIFGELIEQEPRCAMAYWGAAMSVWHPLWAPPSVADLNRGAELLAAADRLDATPRERAYMDALRAFFSDADPSTHTVRTQSYAIAMSTVYQRYFELDTESAVFYALALLAAADPRDKTYSNQFRSAGLLNWVRESQPTHPGALHYIIHSYDFPGLAHLALSAAQEYATAAPDSAHAQHMPSHIFTRLGLWEQSLSSNHNSTRSAAEYTKRANLPGHYDEGLHSMDYLMYAMLQTARDEEAANLVRQLADISRTDTENFKVAYTYASSPARYVLERRAWSEAANLAVVRDDFAWQEFGFALSIHHFARGIGAARSGQIEGARVELARIKEIQAVLPASTLTYWREQVQVHIDALNAWVLMSEGKLDAAIKSAKAAADLEDSVDKHPVTPGEVLPARELLADLLLEAGRYTSALVEYEAVLKNAPNRLNALVGAVEAAENSGRTGLAASFRRTIRTQVKNGSGPRAASLRAY